MKTDAEFKNEFYQFKRRTERELWELKNPELFKFNEEVIIYKGEKYERKAVYKGEYGISDLSDVRSPGVYCDPYRICYAEEEGNHIYDIGETDIYKITDNENN